MQTTRVCGCCLQINQYADLRTLYTRPGLGAAEVYAVMLADCFDIHVTLENDDECGICEECVGRLRDASDFKLQVLRSQAELRERLGGALQVKDEEPLVKSETVYEEDETYPPESPVASSPSAGAARDEDSASATPSSVGMFGSGALSARARQQLAMTCVVRLERLRQSQCQPCHVATDHEASLTTHMEDMHTDSAGLRAEEEACTCDTCGEQFTDKTDLVDHIQTHMETTYSCKIIYSKYSRTHKTPKIYTCKNCSKVFSSKFKLQRHGSVHTKRKPYSCDVCNKCFTRKDILIEHIKIHTGQKPYKCEVCDKRFIHKASLNNHMSIHTGQKPYKCEICNKRFRDRTNLNSHFRIHTGQKPYICEICNKQFTQKTTLNNHKTTHTGQKSYKCEKCNKQFTQKRSLDNHMRIHTGQKPYKCDICNKQFIRSSVLKSHMLIHTGQKPYKCEICNKPFLNKGNLTVHIKIHTGEKPYKCVICNKQYIQKSHLNKHMRIHTGQKS